MTNTTYTIKTNETVYVANVYTDSIKRYEALKAEGRYSAAEDAAARARKATRYLVKECGVSEATITMLRTITLR